MMPRSRLRIGASWDCATISRMADSLTARIVASGSRRLKRKAAGSATFQTTWKSMSTTFSSPVSIRPCSSRSPRLTPTSTDRSVVTGITSFVTIGQGAKFRPGSPIEENSPRKSSTDRSSGRTV